MKILNKRKVSIISIVLLSTLAILNYTNSEEVNSTKPFNLPKLPYKYNALEPYIDANTMKIHYQKHHKAYVDNLNAAIIKYPDLMDKSLEYLLSNLDKLPEDIRDAVRNNGGGHYNHSLFWTIMGDQTKTKPGGELMKAIIKDFSSFDEFKNEFKDEATKRFGSGWIWLIDDNDSLKIISTPNQDSPMMDGIVPILGLDVWEHAYYLKYQNRRGDYIDNWWHVVNWEEVENRYNDL
jgi:Fe-Mn family superoxide dismutase